MALDLVTGLALFPTLALLALPAQSPDTALPKAEAILAKLEAAIGEPAARARVHNIVKTGSMSIGGMGGEGKVEEVFAGSDRAKQTVSWGAAYGSTMGL